jgi:hypothetical protein
MAPADNCTEEKKTAQKMDLWHLRRETSVPHKNHKWKEEERRQGEAEKGGLNGRYPNAEELHDAVVALAQKQAEKEPQHTAQVFPIHHFELRAHQGKFLHVVKGNDGQFLRGKGCAEELKVKFLAHFWRKWKVYLRENWSYGGNLLWKEHGARPLRALRLHHR